MQFEWDEDKVAINVRKHEIGFEGAVSAFYHPCQVAFYDPDHSEDEDREILIGHSNQDYLLLVVYRLRGDTQHHLSTARHASGGRRICARIMA